MKNYSFPVVVTQDEDGMYMARVTGLDGCHTQAKSLDELYQRMQEAVELCLEVKKMKKLKFHQEKFIGVQQIEVSI